MAIKDTMLCKERPVVLRNMLYVAEVEEVFENSRAHLQYRSENKLYTLDLSGFVVSVH